MLVELLAALDLKFFKRMVWGLVVSWRMGPHLGSSWDRWLQGRKNGFEVSIHIIGSLLGGSFQDLEVVRITSICFCHGVSERPILEGNPTLPQESGTNNDHHGSELFTSHGMILQVWVRVVWDSNPRHPNHRAPNHQVTLREIPT